MDYKEFFNKTQPITYNIKRQLGTTFKGQSINAYHLGNNTGKQILLTAGMHAREWISSLFLCELFKSYSKSEGVWIIPICNPDGIKLALDGLIDIEDKRKDFLKTANNGSNDFSLWKANARAVDINVNFDSNWAKGKQNIFYPHSENYVGLYPSSENETQALCQFSKSQDLLFALNFHTKGEVIYYADNLSDENIHKDRLLANSISKLNKYTPIKTKSSFGGFSDWLEEKLNVPALTIELGSDEWTHPIRENKLKALLKRNKKIIDFISNRQFYSL